MHNLKHVRCSQWHTGRGTDRHTDRRVDSMYFLFVTDLLYEHSSALLLGQMTCGSLPIL